MTKNEVLAAITEEIARLKHARQLLLSMEGATTAVHNASARRRPARVVKTKAGRRLTRVQKQHRSGLRRQRSAAQR